MVKGLVKLETAYAMVKLWPSMLTYAPSNCSKGDYSPVTKTILTQKISSHLFLLMLAQSRLRSLWTAYELQTNRTTYDTVFNCDAAQMIEFEPRM